MNIGSHNSFSYLKCLQLWLRPFLFVARCLKYDIYKQYELGVRLFDLRLKFVNNKPVIAHGLMQYPFNKEFLKFLNEKGDCYCRVILEYNKRPKNYEQLLTSFRNYCMYLEGVFQNIKFFGGRNKWDWDQIYKFNTEEPTLDDKYSSTTWKKLDDWFPWLYARLFNKKNLKLGTDKDFLFIDFVGVW